VRGGLIFLLFWGKSKRFKDSQPVSLARHTADVLNTIKVLERFNKNPDNTDWWPILYNVGWLHDIGKIDPGFQVKILKNTDFPDDRFKIDGVEVHHSLFALLFIHSKLMDNSWGKEALSAIMFHHWKSYFPEMILGTGGYAQTLNSKAQIIAKDINQWEKLVNCARIELMPVAEEYEIDTGLFELNRTLIEYFQFNNIGGSNIVLPPYTMIFLPANIIRHDSYPRERRRIFLTGNLMRADHFASMLESNDYDLSFDDIESRINCSFNEMGKILEPTTRDFPWQKQFFDDNEQLINSDLILVAPTGLGKTEFAYLWGAGKKNIFLLPLRAATNKIWQRTRKILKPFIASDMDINKVITLLHSDADSNLYFENSNDNYFKDDDPEFEIGQIMELARSLGGQYIIATADQIAPSALRFPGYEKTQSVLMNSALIIDEVQAYDPRAAAIVTHLLQQNQMLGGTTLLITATLPLFIKDELIKRLGMESVQVKEALAQPVLKSLEDSIRHKLRLISVTDEAEELVDLMLESVKAGKRVLAVFNTVERAQHFYKKCEKRIEKLLLIHSRYTKKHRSEHEADLEESLKKDRSSDQEGCLVIATQVVEASLDIYADILFTEPAPADSLIQRMGRVRREDARRLVTEVLEEPNVYIIYNSGSGDKNPKLASGIGRVYNRDLTTISLLILLEISQDAKISEFWNPDKEMPILNAGKYSCCFSKGAGSDEANKNLINKLSLWENSICLSESMKQLWVEMSYWELQLHLGKRGKDGRNLLGLNERANYLKEYFEILEILDNGYCSRSRAEAQKLFRDINDQDVIPLKYYSDFRGSVLKWLGNDCENHNSSRKYKCSYRSFKNEVLSEYVVSIPYYQIKRMEREGDELRFITVNDIHELIGDIMQDSNDFNYISDWLYKNLKNILIVDINYSSLMGVEYYENK
jgi:CRISPR-associated endonuclease/helicase Cas3